MSADEASEPKTQRVAIRHTLEQRFDRAVRMSTQWLRVRPAPQARTKVSAYSLSLDCGEHFVNWVRDPYQNHLVRLDVIDKVGALGLDVEYIAELTPINPFDFVLEPFAVEHPFEYPQQLLKELAPFLDAKPAGKRMKGWLKELGEKPAPTVERLGKLAAKTAEAITLERATRWRAADTETILASGRGSCWDAAWLATVSLRHMGLAARFACGHRITLLDDLEQADSVSLHAWTEVFLPGAGWIGLDPSSGLFANESYIPFAYAPDPLRVAPIVGFLEACEEQQLERLTVRRLDPETTANAGDTTHWIDLQAVARHVDRDLSAQGLSPSLGMGLTLVSAVDGASSEWHHAALGPGKRIAAENLLLTLRDKLAPGGAVQHGQGEWMAGDELPRWQMALYYRADGEPLCGGDTRIRSLPAGTTPGIDAAKRLAEAMARALGVDPAHVTPAHEDPLPKLLSGTDGPVPAPTAAELTDPTRRGALAQRLSEARGAPTGYALPVRRDTLAGCWRSGTWTFRRGALFLVPGASAMGYRLPLSSLPHDPEADREAQLERSPFDDATPLGDARAAAKARVAKAARPSAAAGTGARPPRTALCIEPRADGLYVFLPPVTDLPHYLELVAAAEAAAEATGLSLCLEGYPPPEDPRLRRLVLAPDPGVLRVSLPQTDSWDERVRLLQTVYDEAWVSGLSAERVTEDGRRIPTGGGVRITLGGRTPAESPLLQRPALLRDLISHFQRHPSLSYFFAGRAVGSSGAGPRPDEGRDDALYELSIALGHLTDAHHKGCVWYADRVLSHLLTDPSGDPKRAEIRVDELYNAARASLRQGRIHIGSFETAPDARTAGLQTVLLMALLARFAKHPGDGKLTRWDLHDRWMLPDVLWDDLRSVIDDLAEHGYPLQLEWFEPLRALRFPVLGTVLIGQAELELRVALEPLPLLAEQATGAGMARFIDVANERVQVRINGMTPERHVLVCNGRRVRLAQSTTHGEYVGGVRYKVTNPPATLHPTVPPIEALVFDLIDTWSGKAVGGCTYVPPSVRYTYGPWGPLGTPPVVAHPGNARPSRDVHYTPPHWVAPQRNVLRLGGFSPWGSGLGPMAPPPSQEGRFPQLLDLIHGK